MAWRTLWEPLRDLVSAAFEGGVDLTANKNGEAAEIEPKDEGW